MKAKTIALLFTAILLLSSACGNAEEIAPEQPPLGQAPEASSASIQSNAQSIGEGATVFLFEVTDSVGNVTSWNVNTNAETVGDALVEAELIEGDVSDFGLMVTHVNGLRADFMEDNAWWAFYIDGEMAMAGVDSINIEEGVTYAFIYTPA